MTAPRVLVAGAVLGQPLGGVRRHAQELLPRAARLLAASGGGMAVLCGRTPPGFELPPPIERLASDVPAGPPLARALREGRALRAALATAHRDGRPFDVVHTGHLPAPAGLPVPLVLTVHDLRRLDPRLASRGARQAAAFALRRAARHAARLVAVSETVRAELAAAAQFPSERILVVRNAADHLPVLPRGPGPGARGPIVCVAHLERRKNQELLLGALARDASLPELILVGGEKQDGRAHLAALARTLGVDGRVRFAGVIGDRELAALYARAGCVVLPSWVEGFGIPLLEARRAGVPLAIADIPVLREVAGPSAAAFAPDDPDGCARALRAALDAGAPDPVPADWTWDASAQALVRAWEFARLA